MNWIVRLGLWWEDSNVKKSEFDKALKVHSESHGFYEDHLSRHDVDLKFLQDRTQTLETGLESIKETQKAPSAALKEIALLKARMDRLELYTGLKREPVAVTLPGEARIS
jgi:hypothetical protein